MKGKGLSKEGRNDGEKEGKKRFQERKEDVKM